MFELRCRCVYQLEDSEGIRAVQLNKDIVKVAAKALQKNLTHLAPLTLPYNELLKFALDLMLRLLGLRRGKAYQPDFRKAFQHFSLHAGNKINITIMPPRGDENIHVLY